MAGITDKSMPYELENNTVDFSGSEPDNHNTQVRGNEWRCPAVDNGMNGTMVVLFKSFMKYKLN